MCAAGLVECRGVRERGVGFDGAEFACACVQRDVWVGGVEVDGCVITYLSAYGFFAGGNWRG